MMFKSFFKLALILASLLQTSDAYRICVVQEAIPACLNMVADTASLNLDFQCSAGRDRLECLKMIQNGLADFAPFDPEDMYIASKFLDDSLAVFLQMRSTLSQLDPFRHMGVALVRNDANINYPADLQGKISCHTGYGRTVGWHMPIPRLISLRLVQPDCTGIQPVFEHELAAVSRFFSRACVPGRWAPDEPTDILLKQRYPNLCSACKDPFRCSESDTFSGFQGTVRCLTQGFGQVAWTTYAVVREMFQADSINPNDIVNFSFLCPEGGRRPLASPFPCFWSAKPWTAYMTRKITAVAVMRDMQQRIVQAVDLARSTNNVQTVEWLTRVLGFDTDDVPFAMDPVASVSASEYLGLSNFTMSIEGRGCRGRVTRFCVISDKEQRKCQDMRMAALSRRVLPEFSCIRGSSSIDCMDRIRRNEADLRTFDSSDAYRAGRTYGLKPVVTEVYPRTQDTASYAVAVVKTNSGINRLEDLRNKRSCHTGFGRTVGWNFPVFALSERQLIYPERCRFGKAVGQFFQQSCVPGAKEFINDVFRDNPISLCGLCRGNPQLPGIGRCSSNPNEEMFADFQGAFHCLVEGGGDVAFVRHTTSFENTDGNNIIDPWAIGLSSSSFRLLCRDGGVRPVDEYQNCNLGSVPTPKVMTDGWKSAERTEEFRAALMKLSDLFSPAVGDQVVFRLFGPYEGVPNLLFTDFAEKLGDTGPVDYYQGLGRDFARMMDMTTCGSSKISITLTTALFSSLVALWMTHW